MIDRDDLPPVPNDPAHPLRPFVFCWTGRGHVDARTWYGETSRDEFHGLERIVRVPRRRSWMGMKPQKGELVVTRDETKYRFDDDPEGELTHDEMMQRLRERHGEYVGRVREHPLVLAWQRGEEIPYTPSEPAFLAGSHVRQNYRGIPEDTRQKLLARDAGEAPGRVVRGNALFVLVDWGRPTRGGSQEHWHVASHLDPA